MNTVRGMVVAVDDQLGPPLRGGPIERLSVYKCTSAPAHACV